MPMLPLTETRSDELTDLLQRVARRADHLGATIGPVRKNDRLLWIRAEFEVFEQFERARPALLQRERDRVTLL